MKFANILVFTIINVIDEIFNIKYIALKKLVKTEMAANFK